MFQPCRCQEVSLEILPPDLVHLFTSSNINYQTFSHFYNQFDSHMHPHYQLKKSREENDTHLNAYQIQRNDRYLEIGKKLEKEGSYYEAIEMYKKNLRTNLMVPSINRIANCYFYLEVYQEAIKWYKKGLNFDRKNKYAFNGLGNVYDVLGDPEKALKNFDQAIKIDKKFCFGYNSLGNFYFKKGQFIAAMKYYEQGIRSSPENCQIKLNLARCFMHLRKYFLSFCELEKVHNIIKQKSNDCEQKFGWIVDQFREKIKNETKMQMNRLKTQLSKKPILGQTWAPEEIDMQKIIKKLLQLKKPNEQQQS